MLISWKSLFLVNKAAGFVMDLERKAGNEGPLSEGFV